MIKALFFDLDDTLLWDKKSVATAFQKTCEAASQTHDIDPYKLEEAVRQKQEVFTQRMRPMNSQK